MLSFETHESESEGQPEAQEQNYPQVDDIRPQELEISKTETELQGSNLPMVKDELRSPKIPERGSEPDPEDAELRTQLHDQLSADIRTVPERSQVRLTRQDITSLAEIVESSIHAAEQAAEKALKLKKFAKELNNRRIQEFARSHREWKPRLEKLRQHVNSAHEKNVALAREIVFLKRYIEVCTKLEARRLGNSDLLDKTIKTAKDMISSIENNGAAISILQNVSDSLEIIEQSNDSKHGDPLAAARLI